MMHDQDNRNSEVSRLEYLWAGDFGDSYTERNLKAGKGRQRFWSRILKEYSVGQSVLEVGCNVGANLQCFCELLDPRMVYGVDINESALAKLRQTLPDVNAIWSPARHLPFRDGWFELVFTAGVLIHQPEISLANVMSEIVRCSNRYVLCLEYFAEKTTEIVYRDQERALFKRTYGRLYEQIFPELNLVEQGKLNRDQGWDNVTYWLFEKGHLILSELS
jgi:pseudaminic acid biosynthesis-associated methylase